MPQIASLPIDEPVSKPQASPRQFGSVGEAVAGLGEETEQLAQGASEVAGHLIAAQRMVRGKQAEIAFERRKMQVYQDLSKTTTPEEAQAVYDHSKGELDNVLTPFEHDRELAKSLGIYRQQEDVEIQNHVNDKKADIITKSDVAATAVISDKQMQIAINTTMAGGDPSAARGAVIEQHRISVQHGTMTPDEAAQKIEKWDKDYELGVAEAYSNSPDQSVRQQAIDQLAGGKGPLDLSKLDQGEINRMLTQAQETDKRLTALQAVGNFNAAYGRVHQVFKGAPYSDQQGNPNYENMRAALDDEKFLLDNGIAIRDRATGKMIPNYTLAKELRSELKSEEADYSDEAKKQADKYRDQIETEFSAGHIAKGLAMARQHVPDFEKARVDYYPAIVSQAKSWTEFQQSEARANRAERNDEERLKMEQDRRYSQETLGNLLIDMNNGRHYTDTELRSKIGNGQGKMSSSDVNNAIQMAHSYENDPANKPFYSAISSSVPDDPALRGELTNELNDYIRRNPNATPQDKSAKVKQLTDQVHIDEVNTAIDGALVKLNASEPKGGPTVVETRTTSSGKVIEKLSDGTLREKGSK